MYGQSNIRTINIETGTVIQQRTLDNRYFAEGLTVYNDLIYLLTWRERTVFIYTSNLTLLATSIIETDGWGITHSHTHIITTDGSSNLYFRSPTTLQLTHTQPVTMLTDGGESVSVSNLNELEWVDGLIYANVWMQPIILCIDPDTGRVIHVWYANSILKDAGGDNGNKVVNGLAYRSGSGGSGGSGGGGGGRWYVTGKYWPKMYEVDLTLPSRQ